MLNLIFYDYGVGLIKPDPNIYFKTATDFGCYVLLAAACEIETADMYCTGCGCSAEIRLFLI
jgi:hypothetical protein